MLSRFDAIVATLLQVEPAELNAACTPEGEATNSVCVLVYRVTGQRLAGTVAGAVLPAALRIVLIVALAYVAQRLVRRLIKRFVRGVTEEGIARLGALRQRGPLAATGPIDLTRATMRTETIGGVLRSISTAVIWTVALFLVLGEFNVNLGPLIAGAGIAGVAIGFGSQTLVRDFLSGIFMLLEDQYGVGDIVDVGEATGVVEAITLRTSRLRDVEGTVWWVPNGEIRRVGNKSQQWARSLMDVGVAYDTDITHAQAVIKGVADDLWRDPEWSEQIIEEPEVWGVENFGPNEIVIRMVMKVQPAKQWAVNRELRARLKQAFDAAGIEIPFAQRTIWVRHEDGAPASTAHPRPEAGPEGIENSGPVLRGPLNAPETPK
ncbi:mechanosensitive ion channel [soil metagenome]